MKFGITVQQAEKLLTRYFWVLPLFSFGMGCASYILVQRGEELARAAAFIALIGWPWILAEPFLLNHFIGQKNPRLSSLVANFFTQSIQQEILFFSLPFLIAATHFEAIGQIAFTILCILAALVTAVDPFYDKYIYSKRAVSLAFHALCCFVAALVIPPLVVKLPTEESLLFALAGVWLVLVVPGIWSAPLISVFSTRSASVLPMACNWPLPSKLIVEASTLTSMPPLPAWTPLRLSSLALSRLPLPICRVGLPASSWMPSLLRAWCQ